MRQFLLYDNFSCVSFQGSNALIYSLEYQFEADGKPLTANRHLDLGADDVQLPACEGLSTLSTVTSIELLQVTIGHQVTPPTPVKHSDARAEIPEYTLTECAMSAA